MSADYVPGTMLSFLFALSNLILTTTLQFQNHCSHYTIERAELSLNFTSLAHHQVSPVFSKEDRKIGHIPHLTVGVSKCERHVYLNLPQHDTFGAQSDIFYLKMVQVSPGKLLSLEDTPCVYLSSHVESFHIQHHSPAQHSGSL